MVGETGALDVSGRIIDTEMSMGDEVLHEEGHASCQTDRSQERVCTPDGGQCLQHERAVLGLDGSGGYACQDQPRGYSLPGGSAVLPGPGRATYLLQYPVDSQKSSSICDFLLFFAFQYVCAFTIVSFLRSWNHPSEYTPRIRQHPSEVPLVLEEYTRGH